MVGPKIMALENNARLDACEHLNVYHSRADASMLREGERGVQRVGGKAASKQTLLAAQIGASASRLWSGGSLSKGRFGGETGLSEPNTVAACLAWHCPLQCRRQDTRFF